MQQAVEARNVKAVERPGGENKRFSFSRMLAIALLAVLAFLWLIPLLWTFDTSLKPEAETTTVPASWLASSFGFGAYAKVLSTSSILRWYFNSFLTAIAITVIAVFLASMAAFAFSRIRFAGGKYLFWIIMAGIMIPSQILIVPLFAQMQTFGMVDTYWGVILPQVVSPLAVFIFKQFFDELPAELEEAATMDGASRWRVYWQLWLPLSRPAIAAVATFTFVTAWNNFIWPFIVITSTQMMTLPVGLSNVQTSYGLRYAQIMASALLGGLPALIAFLFFQREIVQGIAGTGLKG